MANTYEKLYNYTIKRAQKYVVALGTLQAKYPEIRDDVQKMFYDILDDEIEVKEFGKKYPRPE